MGSGLSADGLVFVFFYLTETGGCSGSSIWDMGFKKASYMGFPDPRGVSGMHRKREWGLLDSALLEQFGLVALDVRRFGKEYPLIS